MFFFRKYLQITRKKHVTAGTDTMLSRSAILGSSARKMSVNAPYHIVSLYRRLSYKSYVKKLILGKADSGKLIREKTD